MTKDANDPAQAGTILTGASGAVTLTLPEIQAQSVKAARGAGFSWGMAEEAGFAAAWLAESGLDGPVLLAAYLEAGDGADRSASAPDGGAGTLRAAAGGGLCPLAAGAYLSDIGGPGEGGVAIAGLMHPALILPFLGLVAGATGRIVLVEGPTAPVAVASGGPLDPAAAEALAKRAGPVDLRVTLGAAAPRVGRRAAGVRISPADWARLDALAHRTYVPATAQSRADAGAGGSDND